jgi:hypothetical protein
LPTFRRYITLVALPPFDANGNLPPGIFEADETQLSDRYVTQLPQSSTRRRICEGFFELRRLAEATGIIATQWVDGSFVTDKPDPRDVDVVTFCDYDDLNRMSAAAQRFALENLGGGASTKGRFGTHTFLVPYAPPGHFFHAAFEEARLYWKEWFGRSRGGHPKGIVRMTLGSANQAPKVPW